MSYSRWSHSCWYIWHDCSSGDDLMSQVLAVDGCKRVYLTFMEVYEMISNADYRKLAPTGYLDEKNHPREYEHLRECLVEFINDMRMEYDEDYRAIKQAEHDNWIKYERIRRNSMTQEQRDAEDEWLNERSKDSCYDFMKAKLGEESFASKILEPIPESELDAYEFKKARDRIAGEIFKILSKADQRVPNCTLYLIWHYIQSDQVPIAEREFVRDGDKLGDDNRKEVAGMLRQLGCKIQ